MYWIQVQLQQMIMKSYQIIFCDSWLLNAILSFLWINSVAVLLLSDKLVSYNELSCEYNPRLFYAIIDSSVC